MGRFIFILIFLPALVYGNIAKVDNITFANLSVENGLSNNMVNVIFKDSHGFMWFGTLDGIDRFDGVEVRSFGSKFPKPIDNVHAICESEDSVLWVGTGSGFFLYNPQLDIFHELKYYEESLPVRALVWIGGSNILIGTTLGLFICDTKKKQIVQIKLPAVNADNNFAITDMVLAEVEGCWIASGVGLLYYQIKKNELSLFENPMHPKEISNSFTSISLVGDTVYLGTNGLGLIAFCSKQRRFFKGLDVGHNIITTVDAGGDELALHVGTNGGGLKVIDIKSFAIRTIENDGKTANSISSNSVYSFLIDENNRNWIGTYSGGVCYSHVKSENLKVFQPVDALPEPFKSVRSFYLSPSGETYLGTRNGFVAFDDIGRVRIYKVDQHEQTGLRSNIILTVYPYGNDILLGTYGGGISQYSKKRQRIETFHDNSTFNSGNNYAFEKDNDGNLWIASFNGIYQLLAQTGELINHNKQNSPLANNEVFELKIDSKGRLWVGTMHGVAVFIEKDQRLIPLNLPSGINNTFKINYIYEDVFGDIWVCTERGGMCRLSQNLSEFKHYDINLGLPDNSVCAIAQSDNNEYWVSTLRGFCSFYPKSEVTKQYSISDGLPSLVFNPAAVFVDNDKNLWFGNEKGLVTFSPNEMQQAQLGTKIKLTDLFLFGKPVQPGNESVLCQPLFSTSEITISERQSSIGFRFVDLNYINAADNHYWVKLKGHDAEWRDNGTGNTVFYDKLKAGRYTFLVENRLSGNSSSDMGVGELKIVVKKSLLSSPIFIIVLLVLIAEAIFLFFNYIKSLKIVMRRLTAKPEKYKGSKLTNGKGGEIIDVLRQHMNLHKPYLNPELKLADLAADIGISAHEISQVLNQSLSQGFADFVNKYRLEAFVQHMKNGEYRHLTLFAIAQQCGFNSKTSFYRIFKNEYGMTPSEYQKQIQSEQ